MCRSYSAGTPDPSGCDRLFAADDGHTAAQSVTASSSGSRSRIVEGAACEVVELTLATLDLKLLGLRVQLDEVHLLITADPSGGLLGSSSRSHRRVGRHDGRRALLNQILGLLR